MKLKCPCGSDRFIKITKVNEIVDSEGDPIKRFAYEADKNVYYCENCGKPIFPVDNEIE
jgi:DNA-directed RNA polymerase subunit RPC12/RpoP